MFLIKNKAKAQELNDYIQSVTSNMLNKANRSDVSNFNTEGVFLSAKEDKAARESLNNVIEKLEDRLSSLKKRKSARRTTQRLEDKIDKIKDKLFRAQEEEGLYEFLNFVQTDLRTATGYIQEVREGRRKLNSENVGQLYEFIDYYMPLLREIKKKNNYSPLFTNYNKETQDKISDVIKGLISNLEDIEDFYSDVHNETAKEVIKDFFDRNGLTLDFDLDVAFKRLKQDVNSVQAWFGNIGDLGNEIGRTIYAMVGKAKQRIYRRSYEEGKDLINKIIDELGVKDTSVLAEKVNGKATGYYLTPYQLSSFYKAYDSFNEDLREKYDLEEGQKEPLDAKKALAFRKEKNEWLAENVERLYTKEYYDLQNNLSAKTREELLYIDVQIKEIENKARTEEGDVDYFLLSDSDSNKLEDLKIERKQLGKIYYPNGEKKVGKDLEIAEELQEFYDIINKELQYSVKDKRFKDAAQEAVNRYSKEEYTEWLDANSEEVYDQSFWDLIDSIEEEDARSEELKLLYKKRSQLLSAYKNGKMEVNMSKLPEETRLAVIELDKTIQEANEEIRTDSKDKSMPKIFNYAKIEQTEQFKKLEAKAKEEGTLKEFQAKHYYVDQRGKLKAHSYATHLVPNNKGYIVKQAKWKQLSKNSKYYNPNYDENWLGLQPSQKWSNSDYNNLTANEKEALDILIKTKQDKDNNYQ